jgi:hypothetical protein
MAERITLHVTSEGQRDTCVRHINERALPFHVVVHDKVRTLAQNDRLHPLIRPIAEQLTWHGKKLSVDDWKLVFMDALNREMRVVPNIDGTGFVQLGRKTSKLTVPEMNELMALIEAFAAQHGIDLSMKEEAG